MPQVNARSFRATVVVLLLWSTACSGPSIAPPSTPAAPDVTVFEGARLIVGDGSAPIQNGAFVVEGGVSFRWARPTTSRLLPARQG